MTGLTRPGRRERVAVPGKPASRGGPPCVWFLSALLLCGARSSAQEITVQNDSFTSGGSTFVLGDFATGEHGGVRLTSPCDGAIVAVQIGWLSQLGGTSPSIERAIHIFDDNAAFPQPGTELAVLLGPVLTDGALNEFRFLDDQGTIPLNVPVTAGQQFYVTLEFENATNIAGGTASLFEDVDGCQVGKNVLFGDFGLGVGWWEFCTLGIQGDVVIRAVVDCPDAPGACCLLSGACQDGVTNTACTAQGGTFQGAGTTCGQVSCPQPTGACCFDPSGCLDMLLPDCNIAGGTWQGPGTACAVGGQCPLGACCLPDGTCTDATSSSDCTTLGGQYQGDGSQCANVSCPQPTGACCLSNGNCLPLTQADCAVIPNTLWAGPSTDCTDADMNGTADACEANCLAGDFGGPGGPQVPDGAHDGRDMPGFVVEFLSPGPPGSDGFCRADIVADGVLNDLDVDAFVTCLLSGTCP